MASMNLMKSRGYKTEMKGVLRKSFGDGFVTTIEPEMFLPETLEEERELEVEHGRFHLVLMC